jgi:hypothetical protein
MYTALSEDPRAAGLLTRAGQALIDGDAIAAVTQLETALGDEAFLQAMYDAWLAPGKELIKKVGVELVKEVTKAVELASVMLAVDSFVDALERGGWGRVVVTWQGEAQQAGVRDIDWLNRQYHIVGSTVNETVTVKDGHYSIDPQCCSRVVAADVREPLYADITGDGREEAFVWMSWFPGGNFYESTVAAFSAEGGQPTQIGDVGVGSDVEGAVRAITWDAPYLVVERSHYVEGDFHAQGPTHTRDEYWRWDGHSLVEDVGRRTVERIAATGTPPAGSSSATMPPSNSSAAFDGADGLLFVDIPGDCLNVRAQPGLSSAVLSCAPDGVRAGRVDGPEFVDGQFWWKSADGWMSEAYLRLVRHAECPGPAECGPPPGEFGFWAQARIDIPGDCLNAHSGPGVAVRLTACIPHGVEVTIWSQAESRDGHTWWLVGAPSVPVAGCRDGAGCGWVSEQYLTLVD